jgi:hypothetical protein
VGGVVGMREVMVGAGIAWASPRSPAIILVDRGTGRMQSAVGFAQCTADMLPFVLSVLCWCL